jgi:hypothetical protein
LRRQAARAAEVPDPVFTQRNPHSLSTAKGSVLAGTSGGLGVTERMAVERYYEGREQRLWNTEDAEV